MSLIDAAGWDELCPSNRNETKYQKITTLEQAIKNPFACKEKQLKNWLSMLSEYIDRDTDMQVTQGCLNGKLICPACGEHMALAVESFCDKCGQKIKR